MDLLGTIILCTVLTVLLSLAFGMLPMFFAARWAASLDPSDPGYNRKSKRARMLGFLLNFGGGVLIANCFCHWLPEVRKSKSLNKMC